MEHALMHDGSGHGHRAALSALELFYKQSV
jgi:hypothetical protein